MPRYSGMIGYSHYVDHGDGVYTEELTERPMYGDILRNTRNLEAGASVNDDINIRNEISVVADAYAYQNFAMIRYATWLGLRWKVRSVEVDPPRLLLTLGGLWNGDQCECD